MYPGTFNTILNNKDGGKVSFFFIQQTRFEQYFKQQHPKTQYDPTKVVLAISTIKTKPIINCLYLSDDLFFAARYHSGLDYFADGFSLTGTQIKKMSLHEELLSVKLTIETNVILKNGQPIILKLSLPKLNRTPWHIRNLKKLRLQFAAKKN